MRNREYYEYIDEKSNPTLKEMNLSNIFYNLYLYKNKYLLHQEVEKNINEKIKSFTKDYSIIFYKILDVLLDETDAKCHFKNDHGHFIVSSNIENFIQYLTEQYLNTIEDFHSIIENRTLDLLNSYDFDFIYYHMEILLNDSDYSEIQKQLKLNQLRSLYKYHEKQIDENYKNLLFRLGQLQEICKTQDCEFGIEVGNALSSAITNRINKFINKIENYSNNVLREIDDIIDDYHDILYPKISHEELDEMVKIHVKSRKEALMKMEEEEALKKKKEKEENKIFMQKVKEYCRN